MAKRIGIWKIIGGKIIARIVCGGCERRVVTFKFALGAKVPALRVRHVRCSTCQVVA